MSAPAGRGTEREQEDFSLVLGGPLFQLLRRARFVDDTQALLKKRIFVIALLAWLPLLLLSLASGQAYGGTVAVPFLSDFELHIRFLGALPLLIIAELAVNSRMRPVVQLFRERGVVPEAAKPRFDAAVAAAFRLRNSIIAELALVAVVYAFGIQFVWRRYIALDTATWYATPVPGGTELTTAGIWYGYVSLPIFQFLLCRWYFRIFIWARFLFHVSRIDLHLIPSHPDRLGGLGFLSGLVYAFTPLASTHGAILAGTFANRIFYAGAKLTDFKMETLAMVVFVGLLVFGPLVVFAPQLSAARRKGTREYGTLAQGYVRDFERKWLRGGASADESLLGSGDIQSLADLGNSMEVVRTMRTFPITREAVARVAVATVAPVVPLALTMMPAEELLKQLFGLLF